MSTLNKLKRVFTREGAPAKAFTPADELKRTLMNCLLWEDQFYEDGVSIADRIKQLVPLVEPERASALAITAREDMKLRHAPLLVLREMARLATHRGLVADTLVRVIQRPDEMTELLAIYWADALGPMQQRKRDEDTLCLSHADLRGTPREELVVTGQLHFIEHGIQALLED